MRKVTHKTEIKATKLACFQGLRILTTKTRGVMDSTEQFPEMSKRINIRKSEQQAIVSFGDCTITWTRSIEYLGSTATVTAMG